MIGLRITPETKYNGMTNERMSDSKDAVAHYSIFIYAALMARHLIEVKSIPKTVPPTVLK